jgi:AbrB family looped-hinge helix DNA binding protein
MSKLKISQIDSRGQIVIPKEIREKLKISSGTGFYIYDISNDGILLKKIPDISPNIEQVKKELKRFKK